MAVNGASETINDFQNNNVSGRTALSATEGIAGATAVGATLVAGGSALAAGAGATGAIAAMATNPVGWVALAIGGAALLGKSLYDSANSYKEAGKAVEAEWDNLAKQLEDEADERKANLYTIKGQLQDESEVEDARTALIKSGLLSEEDMQKAQNASKTELEKLTQAYIESTDKFSDSEQNIINALKSEDVEAANETAKDLMDWFSKNKNEKTDQNREMMKQMVTSTVEGINAKGGPQTDAEKEFMKRYQKNLGEGKTSQDDYKWVLEGGGSWWNLSGAVSSNIDLEGISKYAAGAGIEGIDRYSGIDKSSVPYVAAIDQAKDKKSLEEAIKNAKDHNVDYNKYSKWIDPKLEEFGIPKYEVGSDYISAKEQVAILHEGEAVLTSGTTSDIKQLLGTNNIKDWRLDDIKNNKAEQEAIASVLGASVPEIIFSELKSNIEDAVTSAIPDPINVNSVHEFANTFIPEEGIQVNGIDTSLSEGINAISANVSGELLAQTTSISEMNTASVEVVSSNLSSGFSSLSTVITSQTEALVNKLDEVIVAVYSTGRNGQNKISERKTNSNSFMLTTLE